MFLYFLGGSEGKELTVYRIRSWKDYQELALKFKPEIIYYARDRHPLRKPPWGLKLIFYHGFNGYVFIDYADGAILHKTRIPIQGKNTREVPLLIEDIKNFLHSQIGKIKISPIHSFWSY